MAEFKNFMINFIRNRGTARIGYNYLNKERGKG